MIYKKFTKYIVIMIISCFSLTGCNEDGTVSLTDSSVSVSDELSGMENRTFSSDTFSLSTGDNWIYDETRSTALKTDSVSGYYFYRSTDDSTALTNDFSDHMIVIIENLSSTGKDFDTFKDITLKQLNSGLSTELSPESTNINGYEAFKVKYDTTVNEKLSHNYLISMNIENVIYSFSYTCYSENFEDEFKLFEQLISSGKFN